jgi:hypothetical protein
MSGVPKPVSLSVPPAPVSLARDTGQMQLRDQALIFRWWHRKMASPGKVNGLALGAIGIGGVFAWSGLTNQQILKTFQSLIAGKKPTAGATTAIAPAIGATSDETTNASIIAAATGNTGAESNTAAHNQAIAKTLAAPLGWSTGEQWNALVDLWNDESGWSNTAENASGAYGVAQALPSTKYPLPGRPPSEGGSANATVQIAWGLSYILSKYGNPVNALAHENADHWY